MNKAVNALRDIRPLRRSIAAILLVVIALPLISFWATYQISVLSTRVATVDDARLDLSRALRYTLDEETGVRGFAATGVGNFLEPYYAADPQIRRLLARMPGQFRRAGLNGVLPALKDFARLHNSWHVRVATPLLADPHRTGALAIEETGKKLFDRMRADVDGIQARAGVYSQATLRRMFDVMLIAGALAVLWIALVGTFTVIIERRTLQRETELVLSLVDERESVERLSDWRSRLLAMLAHDFKSQLAVVVGAAHLLEDFPQRRSDPQVLASLRSAGYTLADMADNAILLARAQERRLVLYRTPFDMADVASAVVQRYGAQRRFHLSMAMGTAMVDGDRSYVMRVVDNIIGNAVKYSEKPIEVHIGNAAGDQVQISVTDRGAGIAQVDLPHVFEEYFRADTTSSIEKGSGVGLFIVKQIVDAHGGSVRIESKVAEGTTVTVRFPASKQVGREFADAAKPDALV